VGQRDGIVGPYSYMAILKPEKSGIDWRMRKASCGKDELNALLFSRMKVNASKLMSQWKCTSGLHEVRWDARYRREDTYSTRQEYR
jgi:hypothetical protein